MPDTMSSDELLAEFRVQRAAYEEAVTTRNEVIQPAAVGRYVAALACMGRAAELDRLLSAGGHLPEAWRNARR